MNKRRYLFPVCRGSFMLGNNCGSCEKCIEERAERGQVLTHAPQPAEPERMTTVALLTIERDDLAFRLKQSEAYLREACERLADMVESDDGEAFFEGEKFIKRHAPDIYNVIGASAFDPLPDFPEPTLRDKACGFIVGLLIRKPKQ